MRQGREGVAVISERLYSDEWLLENFMLCEYFDLIYAWASAANSPYCLKDWLAAEHPAVLSEFLEVMGATTSGPKGALARAQPRKQAS